MNGSIDAIKSLTMVGEIVSARGGAIVARIPQAAVGDLCWVDSRDGVRKWGQVVSFHDNLFSIALFEDPDGICPGNQVRTRGTQMTVKMGPGLLGRTINPLGAPLDELSGDPETSARRSLYSRPPAASSRPMIEEKLSTGVRAIDGFCTIGYGQKIGIFASAGVGKSTLLAMMARGAAVDVIVVALVGERSREVREFIEDTLGREGLARSVLVVATSDDSSLMRQTAPYTATAIAEYFRDCGKKVLLIVDSLTRMARAIRETSLAAGEMPVRHGYTNSVYTELPKLLERAGTSPRGSITAIYTVLTNQDEDIDPLADEIKSLLDGHLVLRKELATMGVLPAIDITQSISRLFTKLQDPSYRRSARIVTHAMFRLMKEREIVLLGGSPDPELQRILNNQQRLLSLISQSLGDLCLHEDSERLVVQLSNELTGEDGPATPPR
jgi:FliI/YscN family ATPase